MNKTTLAALTGSAVLGMVLAFALVLPAAAQPWSSHMWGDRQGDPISITEARQKALGDLDDIGHSDLTVGEIMEFDNHFYAAVIEPVTGEGAFEVLISLDGRTVHPEPGPNMMWNTEYSPMHGRDGFDMEHGMGSGMMDNMHRSMHSDLSMDEMHGRTGSEMMGNMHRSLGAMNRDMGSGVMGSDGCTEGMGYPRDARAVLEERLTSETVVEYVEEWLDDRGIDMSASDPIAFPGYFTLHTERDGNIVGMLSVHVGTGAVWEHTWHGAFVAIDHGDH
jgi:hypothetical protein